METSNRYLWVDYAKGICILAVVCLYVNSNAIHYYGSSGLLQYFVDFAKPFRMPDFFLLSGLFLARAIDKPLVHYLDRKVFHYLYFFFLWTLISWVIRILTGELNEGPIDLIKSLISMTIIWPFHQLWFILMLPLYFFATRMTRAVPAWVMFPLLCGLHLLQSFPQFQSQFPIINDFNERFVFFYAGYIFAPYIFKMAEMVKQNMLVAIGGILIWFVLNSYLVFGGYSKIGVMTLILGFAGSAAVIAIAVCLMQMQRLFKWLAYLGAHSIAIYLPFDWILIGLSALMVPMLGAIELNLYAAIMLLLTVAGSLLLYWATRSMPVLSALFVRPKWIKLVK